MKYTEIKALSQFEILKVNTGGEYFAPVTLNSAAFTDGVCKAGSPITADGKIDNTESSKAVGILLNDVYDDNPNGTLLKAFGVVNTANADSNAGITISAGVKTALPLIVFA